MAEPVIRKADIYIMAPEPISTAYFINLSRHSTYLHVYPATVARQRLAKNDTAATNTYATIAVLLDASFTLMAMRLMDWKVLGRNANLLGGTEKSNSRHQ
jgi:hypothetical protein